MAGSLNHVFFLYADLMAGVYDSVIEIEMKSIDVAVSGQSSHVTGENSLSLHLPTDGQDPPLCRRRIEE